mmetsp:Transcript_134591/g.429891  ORF Transcript_134591/g.429891 Transcript_134591/m.429891 type:complete len:222 (+) Transcript_134591:707-1372(+)
MQRHIARLGVLEVQPSAQDRRLLVLNAQGGPVPRELRYRQLRLEDPIHDLRAQRLPAGEVDDSRGGRRAGLLRRLRPEECHIAVLDRLLLRHGLGPQGTKLDGGRWVADCDVGLRIHFKLRCGGARSRKQASPYTGVPQYVGMHSHTAQGHFCSNVLGPVCVPGLLAGFVMVLEEMREEPKSKGKGRIKGYDDSYGYNNYGFKGKSVGKGKSKDSYDDYGS